MSCFETVKVISEIALTLVAVIISIIALFQTKKQITLSNKQQLLDRHINCYSIIRDLLSVFSCIRKELVDADDVVKFADNYLSVLLSPQCLREVNNIKELRFDESLEIRYYGKCEWLGNIAEEIEIVFDNNEAELISEFCKHYGQLLKSIYFEHNRIIRLPFNTREGLETDNDSAERELLKANNTIHSLIIEIDEIYNDIVKTNAENKIVKQIRLK